MTTAINMNNETAFLADLAVLLETSPESITEDYPLNDNNWDSLAVISAIAMIDKHFNTTVPGHALSSSSSVGELLGLIRAQQPRA